MNNEYVVRIPFLTKCDAEQVLAEITKRTGYVGSVAVVPYGTGDRLSCARRMEVFTKSVDKKVEVSDE
jgi:hypothetical protein